MTASEILDRRIAELEARLDELRTLRGLLEPAVVPVLPATVQVSTPAKTVPEVTPQPEREPVPNAARPAVERRPAREKAERKPGLPTQLMRERCQSVAKLLAAGPLTRSAIIARSGLSEAVVCNLFQDFGSPPKPTAGAYFKKTGEDHYAPWTLTELGRKELLTPAQPTPNVTAAG